MATAVSICSNALLRLREKPINSFDEANASGGLDRAKICANIWPTVRDSVLRSHPWNCAIKRVQLAYEATAPSFGFTRQYVLPSDWMRNVEINGQLADECDYVVESGRLLIDSDVLKLRYVWKNKDPETWDSLLVHATELLMAAEIAYAITQSTSLRDSWFTAYERKIREARTVDGQDQSPEVFGSFEILGARRSV